MYSDRNKSVGLLIVTYAAGITFLFGCQSGLGCIVNITCIVKSAGLCSTYFLQNWSMEESDTRVANQVEEF